MKKDKPRIIKDYEKLEEEVVEQIKLAYPEGFHDNLIDFFDKDGKKITALPFETEDRYLMIRMTIKKAKKIVEEDDDYDDLGILKEESRVGLEDKYSETDSDY